MSQQVLADRPVLSLKGVGPKTARSLEKLGIRTVKDLLYHLPLRYEDRTRIHPIRALQPGRRVLVEGRIETAEIIARRRPALVCRIEDDSGHLLVRFFHFTARQRTELDHGTMLRCFGEVRSGFSGYEMIHPEYRCISEEQAGIVESRLTPVYPLTDGLNQTTLRRLITQSLELLDDSKLSEALRDWIPPAILSSKHYPSLHEALALLHAPSSDAELEAITRWNHPAQQRLAFEELLAHHLSLTRRLSRMHSHRAPVCHPNPIAEQDFLSTLPFCLTAAQQRVIAEIQSDLSSGSPMMRLVQGDVGSGKTVVAACCALSALAAGYQVAVMAPTELLAEQHYRNFTDWLVPLGVNVLCLTGRYKGKQRTEIVAMIREGDAGVVIGTHALFQEAVHFSRLGFVIIDEQHRFGVHQRAALRAKGLHDGFYPHQLIMTATPIPRTLAMLRFTATAVSAIDELPPGRIPVCTSVLPASRRKEVIQRIDRWVREGRQAYWVCTLIDESELLQCEAAQETMTRLASALPDVRIGLLHGRMKPVEKEAVMLAFMRHEIDVLVATTVIEVGVDVPNAGLMIIENPERLGLSQLHQLRGRVGRGTEQSFCILMYQPPLSDIARQRLSVIRRSNDSFAIAEHDLELRGPGEVLGTRQTGRVEFRVADLARDKALLPDVLEAAERIQQTHPECIEPIIRRWLGDRAGYADI
jgi:ATP-dependent DNA helicase RecG